MTHNTYIEALLQAAKNAKALVENRLETLQDPSLGSKLTDQLDEITSQVTALQNLADVTASGSDLPVLQAKTDLDRLISEKAKKARSSTASTSF